MLTTGCTLMLRSLPTMKYLNTFEDRATTLPSTSLRLYSSEHLTLETFHHARFHSTCNQHDPSP
jgi:hypothetical protein